MINELDIEILKNFSPIKNKRKSEKISLIEEIESHNLNSEEIKTNIQSSNNVLHPMLINNLGYRTHRNSEEISIHLKENSNNTHQNEKKKESS